MGNKIIESAKKSVEGALAKGLAARACIVYLSISKPSMSKKDKEASAELARAKGVSKRHARVNKTLFPGAEEIEAANAGLNSFRNWHYIVTSPLGRDGWAILPASRLQEYKDRFEDTRRDLEEAKRLIRENWGAIMRRTEVELNGIGGLFNPNDYRGVDDLLGDFHLSVEVRGLMPSKVHDLVGIADDVQEAINAENERQLKENLVGSVGSILGKVNKVLSDTLDGLRRKADEKGTFRDSLIENLRELADAVQSSNLLEDRELARLAERIREVGCADPEVVRENPEVLKKKIEEVSSIAEDLKGAF